MWKLVLLTLCTRLVTAHHKADCGQNKPQKQSPEPHIWHHAALTPGRKSEKYKKKNLPTSRTARTWEREREKYLQETGFVLRRGPTGKQK